MPAVFKYKEEMILWLLVSVLLVVFDDKNYPRGFSRHGDYTIKESQVLEQYGQAFKALDSGERKANDKKKKEFVAFAVVNVHQKLSSKNVE